MAIFMKRYVVQGSGPFPFALLQEEAVWLNSQQDIDIANGTGMRQVIVVRDTRVTIPKPQKWQTQGWSLVRDLASQPITSHADAMSLHRGSQ